MNSRTLTSRLVHAPPHLIDGPDSETSSPSALERGRRQRRQANISSIYEAGSPTAWSLLRHHHQLGYEAAIILLALTVAAVIWAARRFARSVS